MMAFADRVVVPKHVLVRHLEGESVLLNLDTERFFGFDVTGTRMWALITTMPNIDAAYEKLLEEFEVEPDILRGHLSELLGLLVDNGLLSVLPSDVGTTPAI